MEVGDLDSLGRLRMRPSSLSGTEDLWLTWELVEDPTVMHDSDMVMATPPGKSPDEKDIIVNLSTRLTCSKYTNG